MEFLCSWNSLTPPGQYGSLLRFETNELLHGLISRSRLFSAIFSESEVVNICFLNEFRSLWVLIPKLERKSRSKSQGIQQATTHYKTFKTTTKPHAKSDLGRIVYSAKKVQVKIFCDTDWSVCEIIIWLGTKNRSQFRVQELLSLFCWLLLHSALRLKFTRTMTKVTVFPRDWRNEELDGDIWSEEILTPILIVDPSSWGTLTKEPSTENSQTWNS